MRDPLTVWREYQRCTYWRANIVFAVVAAVVSAAIMRYSAGHCALAYESERLRRQMPPELREID